jgi:hypothetical protein
MLVHPGNRSGKERRQCQAAYVEIERRSGDERRALSGSDEFDESTGRPLQPSFPN